MEVSSTGFTFTISEYDPEDEACQLQLAASPLHLDWLHSSQTNVEDKAEASGAGERKQESQLGDVTAGGDGADVAAGTTRKEERGSEMGKDEGVTQNFTAGNRF